MEFSSYRVTLVIIIPNGIAMPLNLITGAHLQHAVLAISRSMIRREEELGGPLKPHEVTFLVQEAQNRYQLLANGNPVNVTSLASDVIHGMSYLSNFKTVSLSAEGYHLLRSEFAAGHSALRADIPDLRLQPLSIPEFEEDLS